MTETAPKSLDDKSDAELAREAKARLRRLDPATAKSLVTSVVNKESTGLAGFVQFIRERAVVGLAIGFVIGTQVQAVVKQFISSFVDPLFALLIPGNQALSDRTVTVHLDGRHADFAWGALVYALLDFMFIVFTIYVVVKLFKLDRLDKKN